METMLSLIGRTRAKLDEVNPHHWLTAQIQQWIYDGARDAARKSESLRDSTTVTAIAGTQNYNLSAIAGLKDLIRINRVTYQKVGATDVFPLDYYDFNSLDSMSWATSSRNGPDVYTTWGFPPNITLVLYPLPGDAGTITIYYYRLPNNNVMSDTAQNVEIPQGWEDLCIDYAVWQSLLQDGDSRWQQYKSLYDEHLTDLIATAIRFNDQAGVMNTGSGAQIPAWLWDEGYVG